MPAVCLLDLDTPTTATRARTWAPPLDTHNEHTTSDRSSDSWSHLGPTCAHCGLAIVDKYYFYVDNKEWHPHCLKCDHCGCPLDRETSCFARHGRIFCKRDYYQLMTATCRRCLGQISADQLVMKVAELVYHVACFSCATCGEFLKKGDFFGLKHDQVLCRAHYLDQEMLDVPIASSPPPQKRPHRRRRQKSDNLVTSGAF